MSDYIGDFKGGIVARLERDSERRSELDHERQIALIRLQSHALKWTGTSEELIATITRWYESGWIVAASLQDALESAAYHFLRPDGTAVILPSMATTPPAEANQETSREAFIKGILDSKGWSIFDWANEARVAHATAIDYLRGKTKPFRSTRKKLADALGIQVEKLPV